MMMMHAPAAAAAQTTTPDLMEMWLFHVCTTMRTNRVLTGDANRFSTLTLPIDVAEFAVKVWPPST